MKGFKAEFSLESVDGLFVLVEDDGRAGYAYLLEDGKTRSMVWLYNRLPPPEHFEEARRGNGPLNPKEFVTDQGFDPPQNEYEVAALCRQEESVPDASIYIRGRLHALLKAGRMPGWCVLATKDGPLALRLDLSAGRLREPKHE